MDVILRDSHLFTRVNRHIAMNVTVPKLEYAGKLWEGDGKLETVELAAAKKMFGCSKMTTNTALSAELGLFPLETKIHEENEMTI